MANSKTKKTTGKKTTTKSQVKKTTKKTTTKKPVAKNTNTNNFKVASSTKPKNKITTATKVEAEVVENIIKKKTESPHTKSLAKILIVLVLMLAVVVLIYAGVTFANWFSTKPQQTTNRITTTCFGVDMQEGNSISLTSSGDNPMYPMSEADAMEYVTPYTFTITNNCSTDMYFNVTLNTTGNSDLDGYLTYKLTDGSDNLISKALISSLSTYAPYNNSTYKEGTEDAYSIINSYILDSGFLAKATRNEGQVITAGGSRSYKLYIWMDENITDLTTMNKTFNGKILITEASKNDGLAHIPKCKRATTLHTETCEQTDASNYCSGAGYTASGSKETTTITYGNQSTTPGTLTSGDAFDCDINGDHEYDPETERFYYVSTKTNGITQDPNTAVLIYYNDYVTSPVEWAAKSDYIAAGGNESDFGDYGNTNKGPVTAIKNLPTINDWNTTLTSTTRDITYENNTVRVTGFQYKVNGVDLAARLLTYQEVQSACGNTGMTVRGYLDNCVYLLENTKYTNSVNLTEGTLTESVSTADDRGVWSIYSAGVWASYSLVIRNWYGARPAIEVAKTDIDY